MEMGNASFLEASRRRWKEGGAISESEYKGTQSARGDFVCLGSWSPGGLLLLLLLGGRGLLVLGGSWSSGGLLLLLRLLLLGGLGLLRRGPWSDPFVGARSRGRVWASHQGRGLEAPLCQLCRATLRVRVRSAGESSPALRKAELSRGYPSCRGDRSRDSSIEAPRGCR